MAPAMKSMKAMRAAGSSGLTQSQGFAKVAEGADLKPKVVRTVITAYLDLAATELKKNGKFKLGGVLNMKLKKKPARAARKGVNPFTKEPCVFKAKPASKTVRVLPMKKLKEAIN
jgi:nucleoid DNA-binding protein